MLSSIIKNNEAELSFEFGELGFEKIADAANYCILLETEGEYKGGVNIYLEIGDMHSGDMVYDNLEDAIRCLIYCNGETIE